MQGIIIITSIAFICSILLVTLDTYLNKKTEEEDKITTLLPGYNCGACGYAGCREMAQAILQDLENYKKCRPLRGEKKENLEKYIEENLKK